MWASLYISNVVIEGRSYLSPEIKDSLISSFKGKKLEIEDIVDSLFYVYENIGFFNVKLNIRADTVSKDTVCLYIKPVVEYLPVIKWVKVKGIGLYNALKKTYFPFRNRIFKRKLLLESFIILQHAGLLERGEYTFLQQDRDYVLFVELYPKDELLDVHMMEDEGKVKGSLSVGKISLLSSGLSLSLKSRIENDSSYYYSIHTALILPYIRGFFAGFTYSGAAGTISVKRYDLFFQYITTHLKLEFSLSERNHIFMPGGNITLFGNNVRFSLKGLYGKEMYYADIFGCFEKKAIVFAQENMLVRTQGDAILFLALPLKNDAIFLEADRLFMASLYRNRINVYKRIYLFTDLLNFKDRFSFDVGITYFIKRVGVYLGFLFEEMRKDIRVGVVIGSRNSLFERSMHIL